MACYNVGHNARLLCKVHVDSYSLALTSKCVFTGRTHMQIYGLY